jgi:hypothetical protein
MAAITRQIRKKAIARGALIKPKRKYKKSVWNKKKSCKKCECDVHKGSSMCYRHYILERMKPKSKREF